jgi:hypothetical protein
MYVKLVSDDRDLYRLCRESLAEIPGHNWDISAVDSQEDDDGSDLWLWDYQPSLSLPEFTLVNPSKHLFLVKSQGSCGLSQPRFRRRPYPAETCHPRDPGGVSGTCRFGPRRSDVDCQIPPRRPGRNSAVPHPDEPEAAGIRSGPYDVPNARRPRFSRTAHCHQRVLRAPAR